MTSKQPRVILASRLFPPEVGAAAFRLSAFAKALNATGANVTVVTTKPPRQAGFQSDELHLTVRRAPVLRDAGGNVRGYIQYLSFDVPLFVRLLARRADVVIAEPPPTTGFVVAVTSWLRRRPFAYYAADIWTDALVALGANRLLVRVMRTLESWVLRRASVVLAVSDEVAHRVKQLGSAPRKVVVVGNGIDTDVFHPPDAVPEGSAPLFVYTGIMSEWQDPSVFVRAMPMVQKRFPHAQLKFFGHGSEVEALKSLAAGIEGVSFGGVVPPQEAAAWIGRATAALASIKPGLGYDFAKPTKIYAAAACGTPVVFAGIGAGAALVTKNSLGWNCGHNAAEAAEAMIAAAEVANAGADNDGRSARTQWVRENASLAAVGLRAAQAIQALDVSRRTQTRQD